MKAWDGVEREIMEFISDVDNPIRVDYGFKYKGTLHLDFETFPASSVQEENNGKNLDIAYDTDDLDNPTKWILYPTKKYGKKLNSEEVDNLFKSNEHFGIYNSYHEMKEAEENIVQYFKDTENSKIKITGAINYIKKDSDE